VVRGLMDQKGIRKATLVGNSMGGQTAALFALRYPERVDKLVLVDAAGLHRAPFGIRLLTRHTNRVADAIARRAQRRAKGKTPEELYPVLKAEFFNPEKRRGPAVFADAKSANAAAMLDGYAHYYANLVKTEQFPWHVKAALRSMRSIVRTGLAGQVHAVSAPTLIIWGERDELVPVKFAELFHQGIPGSKLVWIKAAGHVPMLEQPEEFNRALAEFLAGG